MCHTQERVVRLGWRLARSAEPVLTMKLSGDFFLKFVPIALLTCLTCFTKNRLPLCHAESKVKSDRQEEKTITVKQRCVSPTNSRVKHGGMLRVACSFSVGCCNHRLSLRRRVLQAPAVGQSRANTHTNATHNPPTWQVVATHAPVTTHKEEPTVFAFAPVVVCGNGQVSHLCNVMFFLT